MSGVGSSTKTHGFVDNQNDYTQRGKEYLEGARRKLQDEKFLSAQELFIKAEYAFKKIDPSKRNIEVDGYLAQAYLERGDLLRRMGLFEKARACYEAAREFGPDAASQKLQALNVPKAQSSLQKSTSQSVVASLSSLGIPISSQFDVLHFKHNPPPADTEHYEVVTDPNDIKNTHHLAQCLQTLKPSAAQELNKLAFNILEVFGKREPKNLDVWREVIPLAATPDPEKFRYLLGEVYKVLSENPLDLSALQSLAVIIHNLPPEPLSKRSARDLVKLLQALTERLRSQHREGNIQQFQPLLQITSQILDAMAKVGATSINRTQVQEPLDKILSELMKTPALRFQAYYARQALAHIPNEGSDTSRWQEVWDRSVRVVLGAATLASAVRTLDQNELLEAFDHFSEVFSGAEQAVKRLAELADEMKDFGSGVQEAGTAIRERLTKSRPDRWYAALQFLDTCLEEGQFIQFEQFARQSPFRSNEAFLLGLCQRLEQIVRTQKEEAIQGAAIQFLGEFLQNENQLWGQYERMRQAVRHVLGRLENVKGLPDQIRKQAKVILEQLPPSAQQAGMESEVDCYVVPVWDPAWQQVSTQSLYKARNDDRRLTQNVALQEHRVDMLPNISSQSPQPSVTSYLPQLASAFFDTAARIHSANRVYDTASSVMLQISSGVASIPIHGSSHDITVNYHSTPEDANLLAEILRPLQSTAWQPNTAPLASLDIKTLQKKYLEGLQKDNEIKDALAIYVAPECTSITNTKERFSLEEKVRDFLASKEKKVLLLLGVAGSGKSTFNRHLACRLWDDYNKAESSQECPIPLFIPLSTLKNSGENLIAEYLKEQGLSAAQIEVLRMSRHFIFILDSYDEIVPRSRAFYSDNGLDRWQAHVIISSRPEYLGSNYQYMFHPPGERTALQEYQLAPFSGETIKQYVDQYKKAHPEGSWSAEQYKEALKHGDLKELVGNPFLLKITLSVLPELSKALKEKDQHFTRLALYDQFVKSWFERSEDRLRRIQLKEDERKAFNRLSEEGFGEHSVAFSKRFAVAMYQAQAVAVTYLAANRSESQNWEPFLGSDNEETRLLRFNAPLSRQGNQYRFIHKTLQDYFVARALWEEMREQLDLSNELSVVRNLRPLWEGLGDLVKLEPSALFNQLNVVEDPAVLSFLAERVRQEGGLIKPLLGWVKASKAQDGIEKAAANALTILVKAGGQFNGLDLRKIKVPGADLRYGIFDSAQLQGADLSQVKFRGAWLRKANLEGANLKEVKFGELPSLEVGRWVNDCCYSSDGRWLAVGTGTGKDGDGAIRLYQIEKLELVQVNTFEEPKSWVNSVTFSPKKGEGEVLASGSGDGMVRLWNVGSGVNLKELNHGGSVNSVSFSRNGEMLASGSTDGTVKLWSMKSGKEFGNALHTILESHYKGVNSVTFSLEGKKILASGGTDGTVKLWSMEDGEEFGKALALKVHHGIVNSVSFSPDGTILASGGADKTVKLWKIEVLPRLEKEPEEPRTLRGHNNEVRSVTFSPDGKILASGGADWMVNLWNVESGEVLYTFEGHTSLVNSVNFSPNSDFLASGGPDKMVRLWRVEGSEELHALEGHRGPVHSVDLSPNGEILASGGSDKTVKLWSVESGEMLQTLEGHSDQVTSVSFSPDDRFLASGSWDGAVKMWQRSVESGGAWAILDRPLLVGHEASVWSVRFSSNGKFVASGSNDKMVRLWNVQSGQELRKFVGHSEWVSSVIFSPDSQFLASGSWDKTVKLWSIESGEILYTLEGHSDWVTTVNFSPDSQFLASGSGDKTVKLWRMRSGEGLCILYYTLQGHCDQVTSVNFSPDGGVLASGSKDNTVKLWSVESGEMLYTLAGFVGKIKSIDWQNPSERRVKMKMAGNMGSAVHIWQIEREDKDWTVELGWTSSQNERVVAGMSIHGAQNLSLMDIRLLKQRGALGEPEANPLRLISR
ncbi:hypothetical protein EBME_1205 [bacterium endosymbiont of Mortierella elongata FMR23-6]|nr:hypothetical protein EBME_1205 [bacterium endosymbiont of Mortierella elongata FMR23-6]